MFVATLNRRSDRDASRLMGFSRGMIGWAAFFVAMYFDQGAIRIHQGASKTGLLKKLIFLIYSLQVSVGRASLPTSQDKAVRLRCLPG